MKSIFVAFSCLTLLSCAGSSESSLRAVVLRELSSHPEARLQDIYKLLFQGEFGVGHIIASRDMAASYLEEEIRTMPGLPGEPLTEPCAADGSMLRVNLRPFTARKLPRSLLIDAMMETAAEVHADTLRFEKNWLRVRALVEGGKLPFALTEFDAFTRGIKEKNYPYVHHSDAYGNRYQPAYRVVLQRVFSKYFPGEK
jgi:hypothetical protein